MDRFEVFVPQHLIFGKGTFSQLATLPMPGKKALVVTTKERLFIDRAIELLEQNGVECVVYDNIRPNPSSDNINEGAEFGLKNGCDFVVSVGGGSPMDSSKCIAMLMHEGPGNDIWDYVHYFEGHKVPTGCLPVILVSTTAGTGSEVTPCGVLSNDELNVKLDVSHPCMFPTYSIVDPELHVSIPKHLTACQGMDVVLHCIEGFLNKFHTPFSDMVYMTALKYAADSLAIAYNEPENLDARSAMAYASNLTGIGQSLVDVISLHAMGHTLGSFHHDLPHGVSICLMAPEAFEFYCGYPEETRKRMAFMAKLTGSGDKPENLVDFMVKILKDIDLYVIDYRAYGIDPSRSREYARHTIKEIAPYMNKDERCPTEDELTAIFEKAFARHDRLLKNN